MKNPCVCHLWLGIQKKIKEGSRVNAIVNNTDFAPTIINMAGGTTPEYMQGNSFYNILTTGKEPAEWKKETYYRYWMHMAHKHNNPAHFGIRTKDYKLIFFYGRDYNSQRNTEAQEWAHNPESMSYFNTPPAWEFYDLKNDPKEMNNLYGDEKYNDIIKELKDRLKNLRKEVKEDDSKYPEIQKVIDEYWD